MLGAETALRHRQHTQAKETRRRQLSGHTLTRIRRTEIIHLRLHTVQRNLWLKPASYAQKPHGQRAQSPGSGQFTRARNRRTCAPRTRYQPGRLQPRRALHGGGKRLQVCGSVQESMRMLHRKHLHPIKVRVIAARHPRRRAVLQAANGSRQNGRVRGGDNSSWTVASPPLKLTGTPAVLRRVLLQGGKLGIQQALQAVLFAVVLDRGGHPVHDRALPVSGLRRYLRQRLGDEFRDFDREGKRCRRIQACRALVAGQKNRGCARRPAGSTPSFSASVSSRRRCSAGESAAEYAPNQPGEVEERGLGSACSDSGPAPYHPRRTQVKGRGTSHSRCSRLH